MDLKPDNILLKGKNLYVADFGVSKRIDEINKQDEYIGSEWKATLRTTSPEMLQNKNL